MEEQDSGSDTGAIPTASKGENERLKLCPISLCGGRKKSQGDAKEKPKKARHSGTKKSRKPSYLWRRVSSRQYRETSSSEMSIQTSNEELTSSNAAQGRQAPERDDGGTSTLPPELDGDSQSDLVVHHREHQLQAEQQQNEVEVVDTAVVEPRTSIPRVIASPSPLAPSADHAIPEARNGLSQSLENAV